MVVYAEREEAVAELLVGDEVLCYGEEVEELWGIGRRISLGVFALARGDAVGWDLVEDA